MDAPSEPASHARGFDRTLAECASAASKALSRPGGWTELTGRARECYQRLLTLVCFMHMADGHNSDQVWDFVANYVGRVHRLEAEGALTCRRQDSEPFALSSTAGSKANPADAAPLGMPSVPGNPAGVSQHSDNPYANARAARFTPVSEEPLSKKLRAWPGPVQPAPPEREFDAPAAAGYAMPFGAPSTPHQLLMSMGPDAPPARAAKPCATAPTLDTGMPGASYVEQQ